jgi:hypothetical protein
MVWPIKLRKVEFKLSEHVVVIFGKSYGVPRLANALIDELLNPMVEYVENLQCEFLCATLILGCLN